MSKKQIHRAQILLEETQYEQLAAIAAQKGQSVSATIRDLVGDYIADQKATARRAAALANLEAATALRRKLERKYGVYGGDLLEEIRAERDAEMTRVWQGDE